MSTVALTESAVHRDPVGARFGMWLFLFTELLFFGGLFLLYAVYRTTFPADFHFAATQLDVRVGALNTLILLTSSLTMALAIAVLQRGGRRVARAWLAATILLGLAFLINKGFEWGAKIGHGLYPESPELLVHTHGENVFYGLYYAMTGLHALHVLVGLGVLAGMFIMLARPTRRAAEAGAAGGTGAPAYPSGGPSVREPAAGGPADSPAAQKLETGGLYWHLVDIIWIFLFPLFYLIS